MKKIEIVLSVVDTKQCEIAKGESRRKEKKFKYTKIVNLLSSGDKKRVRMKGKFNYEKFTVSSSSP